MAPWICKDSPISTVLLLGPTCTPSLVQLITAASRSPQRKSSESPGAATCTSGWEIWYLVGGSAEGRREKTRQVGRGRGERPAEVGGAPAIPGEQAGLSPPPRKPGRGPGPRAECVKRDPEEAPSRSCPHSHHTPQLNPRPDPAWKGIGQGNLSARGQPTACNPERVHRRGILVVRTPVLHTFSFNMTAACVHTCTHTHTCAPTHMHTHTCCVDFACSHKAEPLKMPQTREKRTGPSTKLPPACP